MEGDPGENMTTISFSVTLQDAFRRGGADEVIYTIGRNKCPMFAK